MRKISLFLLFGVLLAGCVGQKEQTDTESSDRDQLTQKIQPSQDFKTYLYKSGIVIYDLRGTPEGKETLYWDNWGMNAARYTETWASATPDKIDTIIVIMDHDKTFTINLVNKTGVVSPLRPKEVLDFSVGKEEIMEQEMSRRGVVGGYKVLPDESVLGVPCQVAELEVMGNLNKQWVHKGIMLRMETVSNENGTLFSSQEAIEFNPDTLVDQSVFTIPGGIKMKTLSEVQAESRKEMRTMYKNSDNGE